MRPSTWRLSLPSRRPARRQPASSWALRVSRSSSMPSAVLWPNLLTMELLSAARRRHRSQWSTGKTQIRNRSCRLARFITYMNRWYYHHKTKLRTKDATKITIVSRESFSPLTCSISISQARAQTAPRTPPTRCPPTCPPTPWSIRRQRMASTIWKSRDRAKDQKKPLTSTEPIAARTSSKRVPAAVSTTVSSV